MLKRKIQYGGIGRKMGGVSKAIGKVARVGLGFSTGGISEALGLGKKVEGLGSKVKGTTVDDSAATEELEKEKETTSRQRIKLYATKGEELGEEVFNVGDESKKKRGKIFGN